MSETKFLSLGEIATTVFEHLLKQGVSALHPTTGYCQYRNANGQTCAVGCLIRADLYDPVIEGVSLNDVDVNDAEVSYNERKRRLYTILRKSNINVDDPITFELLQSLQLLHDERGAGHHPWSKQELRQSAFGTAKYFKVLEQLEAVTRGEDDVE